jgi:predicted porin
VTFNSAVVLDDKTDLNLTYLYYQAGDYNNNSSYGLPLGTGAEEHGVTATITRRINQHLRVNLKYAYSHYNDRASGGNNNYDAQMVYTSLQYRF